MPSSEDKQRFLATLNLHHTWPDVYSFKFVVSKEQVQVLRALLPGVLSERPSKTGKYVAVSARARMQSAEEVWAVYERAAVIDGLLSL